MQITVRIDGREQSISVPDDATPEEIDQIVNAESGAAPPPSPSGEGLGLLGDIGGTLSRGAAAGFGDEISAAGQAVLSKLTGGDGGLSWPDLYRHYQQQADQSVDRFAADNPFSAGMVEGAGGIVTGVGGAGTKLGAKITERVADLGTGLLSRLGVAGGSGAFAGALQGAGNADAGQVAEGTLEGAAFGGLTGLGFGLGTEIASPIAQRLREPMRALLDRVYEVTGAKSVAESAVPISRAAPALPSVPPPPEPKLTPEKAKILEAIERDKLTPAQVADQLAADRALGKPVGIIDAAGDNVRGLGRATVTLPGQGRQTGVAALDERNRGQKTRVIADSETAFGQPAQNADLVGESMQKSRAAQAQQDYDESLMGMKLEPTLELLEKLESVPAYREAWQGVTAGLTRAGKPIPPLFDKSGKLMRSPTVNDIDWIKRGIDGEVYTARGRAMDRAASYEKAALGELEERNKELLAIADPLAPGYDTARANFANATEQMKALELGQKYGEISPREFELEWRKLTPAQKEVARIGVLDQIRLRAGKVANAKRPDVAAAIYGSGNGDKADIAQVVARSPEEFDQWAQRMALESRMHETDRYVLGGSQTANKVAESDDALLTPERVAHATITAGGGSLRSGAVELLHSLGTGLVGRWRSGITEGTRSKVADELFNFSDAERSQAFLRELEQIRIAREARMSNRRTYTGTAGAFLGGTVGDGN